MKSFATSRKNKEDSPWSLKIKNRKNARIVFVRGDKIVSMSPDKSDIIDEINEVKNQEEAKEESNIEYLSKEIISLKEDKDRLKEVCERCSCKIIFNDEEGSLISPDDDWNVPQRDFLDDDQEDDEYPAVLSEDGGEFSEGTEEESIEQEENPDIKYSSDESECDDVLTGDDVDSAPSEEIVAPSHSEPEPPISDTIDDVSEEIEVYDQPESWKFLVNSREIGKTTVKGLDISIDIANDEAFAPGTKLYPFGDDKSYKYPFPRTNFEMPFTSRSGDGYLEVKTTELDFYLEIVSWKIEGKDIEHSNILGPISVKWQSNF